MSRNGARTSTLRALSQRLNPCYSGCPATGKKRKTRERKGKVLILVIVDVPQRDENFFLVVEEKLSLNPCYSGCPATGFTVQFISLANGVLILVIVEVPQRVK